MVDLYSAIYDTTDPSDLPTTDAWQLRQAFVGKDEAARLDAIRHMLGLGKDGLQKEATRALVARAATLIVPDAKLAKGRSGPHLGDARSGLRPGGGAVDRRRLGQWTTRRAIAAGRCLRLARPMLLTSASSRISGFIRRDNSPQKLRSAFLVAGLAGLGRISVDTANSLNRRYGLGLGASTAGLA